MKLVEEFTSKSLAQTEDIARKLIQTFTKGSVIELEGNLGVGKTYFVKSFCKQLGIENSSSPSFSIVNEYQSDIKIFHFDFYRINKVEELYDIGFDDYLNDQDSIIFIEWGELFEEVLPKQRFKLSINMNKDNSRQLNLFRYE